MLLSIGSNFKRPPSFGHEEGNSAKIGLLASLYKVVLLSRPSNWANRQSKDRYGQLANRME